MSSLYVGLHGMLYSDMFDDSIDENALKYLDENALALAEAAALNEAVYYGKNKYLRQVEAIFQDMCDDYQSRSQAIDVYDFCNDKRFDKVGKLLAKCFGFKDVVINAGGAAIYSTYINFAQLAQNPASVVALGAPNAFTVTNSNITKIVRTVNSNGKLTEKYQIPGENREAIKITDSSSYRLDMVIHPTLFYNHGKDVNLTGAEITAIVCHEIGHNFYKPSPARALADLALDCIGMNIKNIIFGEMLHTGINAFTEFIPEQFRPVIRTFFTIPAKIFGSLYSALGWIFHLIWAFESYKIFLYLIKYFNYIDKLIDLKAHAKSFAKATIKYDDEKFADSFAAAYGYGPELYTALDKLPKIHDPGCYFSGKEVKIIRAIIENTKAVLTFPTQLLFWYLDPHGENEARLKNVLDYMEASNMAVDDPKLRKEYDEQLKTIREIRENVKNPTVSCPENLRKALIVCLQDMVNCSDVRELTSAIKPKVKSIANLDYAD